MRDMEFVFDLDDTLYRERNYVYSALNFIAHVVETLYNVHDCAPQLVRWFEDGQADPIGTLWDNEQLPPSSKKDVVAAMRAHLPSIALDMEAEIVLNRLRISGAGFSIVTDGRSVTQRAKLAALGCLDAKFISISEEVGLAKIDLSRFRDVERRCPAQRYVYIGDNPSKDFIVPNKLGWVTVMIANDGTNIHRQSFETLDANAPLHVVKSLEEVWNLL
jgi:putative hydrolase of the HAD superfamily